VAHVKSALSIRTSKYQPGVPIPAGTDEVPPSGVS
jgi:hypothetical protein